MPRSAYELADTLRLKSLSIQTAEDNPLTTTIGVPSGTRS